MMKHESNSNFYRIQDKKNVKISKIVERLSENFVDLFFSSFFCFSALMTVEFTKETHKRMSEKKKMEEWSEKFFCYSCSLMYSPPLM